MYIFLSAIVLPLAKFQTSDLVDQQRSLSSNRSFFKNFIRKQSYDPFSLNSSNSFKPSKRRTIFEQSFRESRTILLFLSYLVTSKESNQGMLIRGSNTCPIQSVLKIEPLDPCLLPDSEPTLFSFSFTKKFWAFVTTEGELYKVESLRDHEVD